MQKITIDEKELLPIINNCYEVLKVDNNCQLERFIANHKLKYEATCIYFEFVNKAEEITDDKKVIIMKEVTF